MIKPNSVMRVARPTDNLVKISQMYEKGLGFTILAQFNDHLGFDGIILGHPHHPYHLEFTHHRGTKVGRAPNKEHLLVFYLPNKKAWQDACNALKKAGFRPVVSYNPYWDQAGKTFEDVDGYRIVLQNHAWPT